ncbi:UNVERIFIED_CONTAM: coatomer subunit alpha, partial [Siphonaria sp. JEL0065]
KAVACLDDDLSTVKVELEKTRKSSAKVVSDSQNVPSTPRNVPSTSNSSKRFAAGSICSSPLPPSDLPSIVTPAGISWNLESTAMTGNISDSRAKPGRKRQREEIDESEDPSQPPLEYTTPTTTEEPTSTAATDTTHTLPERDPMSILIKTRMDRLEPHFHDLQQNYFASRLQGIQVPSIIHSSTSFLNPSLTKSSSTLSDTLIRPSTQQTQPTNRSFAETLSSFSKTSHFRTLARINYADKLVSGNGGTNGGSGGNTGSSSIVSAIEFDRDDEYFATAGVTKKVKIYEFESVVKDWGEVFGGSGGGGPSLASRRGYLGKSGLGNLFVADALRDEEGDEGENSEDEETGAGRLFGGATGRHVMPDVVPRYPILEMTGRSKISCLSWNSYIKNHLASSDYEGIVTLWDSNTGVATRVFEEHEKRTWSVDFNLVDPVLLASGSDDTKVKIWSTTQDKAVQTIESKANICSVKWNPVSKHELAFGSADHNIHLYDLRNPSEPLHVLVGHKKAVSYVKFLSRNELVSASTDSTLRLWSLNGPSGSSSSSVKDTPSTPTSPAPSSLFQPLSSFIKTNLAENILTSRIFRQSAAPVLSLATRSRPNSIVRQLSAAPPTTTTDPSTKPHCLRSYSGHTNEKNFVGLSINSTGDFIACGSENNTVYTYYNSLPKPVIAHRFGNSLDSTNGEEVMDPEPSQFVSSVCWKRKSPDVLIAANSVGGVKVMQLV